MYLIFFYRVLSKPYYTHSSLPCLFVVYSSDVNIDVCVFIRVPVTDSFLIFMYILRKYTENLPFYTLCYNQKSTCYECQIFF
jgi:hypothetical protein